MTMRHSCTLLLASVLCCVVLVAEGNPTRVVQLVGQPEPDDFIPVDGKITKADDDEAEEYRFLTNTGTGPATAAAINNLITQEQEALERLRPTTTSSTLNSLNSLYGTNSLNSLYGTNSAYGSGSNVIVLNPGTSGTSALSSGISSGVPSAILPTVIYAGQRRRRRRPGNRNRNRNRNRKGGAQVFLVRPK